MGKHSELLNKIEEELNSLTQDELYNLLTDLGLKGLEKLKDGKGKVIIEKEDNYE